MLVSTSESQTKICAVMDTGHVWLGTLAGTIRRFENKQKKDIFPSFLRLSFPHELKKLNPH